MRTTVNIDQDIVEIARSLAGTRGISLGEAISVLARRGIAASVDPRKQSGADEGQFPTFSVADATPEFGTAEVKQALEDE
ncbi:MAG: hypothetical protein PF508_16930 [Spirochaeta sp.]|jgi:hypothetical protein|nr:hypothetical protein [Spirochaeta sp.]